MDLYSRYPDRGTGVQPRIRRHRRRGRRAPLAELDGDPVGSRRPGDGDQPGSAEISGCTSCSRAVARRSGACSSPSSNAWPSASVASRSSSGRGEPEAHGMFESAGYAACEPWRPFIGKGVSICMENLRSMEPASRRGSRTSRRRSRCRGRWCGRGVGGCAGRDHEGDEALLALVRDTGRRRGGRVGERSGGARRRAARRRRSTAGRTSPRAVNRRREVAEARPAADDQHAALVQRRERGAEREARLWVEVVPHDTATMGTLASGPRPSAGRTCCGPSRAAVKFETVVMPCGRAGRRPWPRPAGEPAAGYAEPARVGWEAGVVVDQPGRRTVVDREVAPRPSGR